MHHGIREDIEKILNAAIWAPSGDNSQPWRFRVTGNQIYIFNRPDLDIPFFNYRQRGSFVAHGGLIENLLIASSALGYAAVLTLFPEGDESDLVATVELEAAAPKPEPLYPFITKRATNRRPYLPRILTDAQKQEILKTAEEVGMGEVRLVEDDARKQALGGAFSANERVVLETPELRRIFFYHAVWTEIEERRRRTGLYVKTLELSPPQQIVFRLYRYPFFAKIFNAIGLSKFIARDNAKLYARASALGAVIVPGISGKDFIFAGRLMQRIWLKATSMGLSVHPVTGVLFLMQRVLANAADGLAPYHITLLRSAYQEMQSIWGVKNETIGMAFRIGYGGEPSARSSRLPPQIEVQ